MNMKSVTRLLIVVAVLANHAPVPAGELDPPGPPAPTMATLQEIYDEVSPFPDTCFDNVGRFVECGDGTVKDNLTGLFWLKDANCPAGGRSWADASIFAAQLTDGQCGLTDGSLPGEWRLPTSDEWQVLLDQARANNCSAPFFPDVVGTGCCGIGTCPLTGLVSSQYWTSTTMTAQPSFAFQASVSVGAITQAGKGSPFFVLAVRVAR